MKTTMDSKEPICIHIPICKDTTLMRSKKKTMVYPEVCEFVCKCCKKVFRFSKDAEGKYHIIV